eukprot:1638762-Pleurochrysis_carterae.AAC.1
MERIMVDSLSRQLLAMGAIIKYFRTDAVGFSILPDTWDEDKFNLRTCKYVQLFHDSDRHPVTGKQLYFDIRPIVGLERSKHHQLCRVRP